MSSLKQRVALSACLLTANARRPRPRLCASPNNREEGCVCPLLASQESQVSQASQGEEASEEMLDAAIVGAGPAGLALAIGLLAKGLRVRVFEAAPEIKERGAAVFMQVSCLFKAAFACFFRLSLSLVGVLGAVSYTHLRAHETPEHLVCRLLL